MPVAIYPSVARRVVTRPPKVIVRFRLLREGEVTTTAKYLRLYRSWEGIQSPEMAFFTEDGAGEFTQTYSVSLAELLAQGEWLACGVDNAPPRKTRAVYLTLDAAGLYTYNITSGESGGSSGDPATLNAVVRVDGKPGNREVLVVEKPSDGQWRIAGYGATEGGIVDLELRVTDGICYAVGLDDWGTLYQPSLQVVEGQVIRPTVMTGWLFRITEPGTLPVTEPEWWDDRLTGTQPLGTARAEVIRYYMPQARGPIPVEFA